MELKTHKKTQVTPFGPKHTQAVTSNYIKIKTSNEVECVHKQSKGCLIVVNNKINVLEEL